MDALELQAALVKLDPATTVTPIGSNVNLVPQHQINFNVNVDETDLTLQNAHNAQQQQQQQLTSNTATRKTSGICNQNHQNPANQPIKCTITEVR